MAPFIIKELPAIIDRMNAAYSIPLSQRQPFKIILIGTSGGAQVALAAAPYLDG